ncbi:response regulator transcription factor [Pseudobdellovibrio exovorus]|uniref:Two-component response regulator n=1 Tax=Pseudobdellovibrio exovorus JSS TaxID=1184267 RepID=M4V5K4_9BACT|nr:response regulator transcription factor [Pseudobdellovibrio exovorus]AGH94632.1 two-component response regulator [Pseudobdellovibrio exovorus JSS]
MKDSGTKKKIMIVDDFEESCQLMVEILSSEFECHYVCQAEKALELIHALKPHLIIMDYKMPYVTGVELCKIIKDAPSLRHIPIIFISGAVSSDERIETLESGGDDFLSKPFHPKELMLRVKKRLQSYALESISQLKVGNLKMNLNSRQCFLDNQEVVLTPKQFETLKLLIENRNQAVSRQLFMTEIWGHADVTQRNVDSQINYLKKKINGFIGQISSVPGFGYRLDGE